MLSTTSGVFCDYLHTAPAQFCSLRLRGWRLAPFAFPLSNISTFVRSHHLESDSGVTGRSRLHGPSLTCPHLLFEKGEVCWSGGMNMP